MCYLIALAIALASCSGGDTPEPSISATSSSTSEALGTTVQVSVTATDPDGDQLHYRWAATEGTIKNVDAPKTTWVIPPGSGLSFVYALVSDNKGGYTEKRAAALAYNTPIATSDIAATPPSDPSTRFAWGTLYYEGSLKRNVYLPNIPIQLTVNNNPMTIHTDMKGDFFIPNLSSGSYQATATLPGGRLVAFTIPVQTTPPTSLSAASYIRQSVDASLSPTTNLVIAGRVELQDGSLCGIRNEFFTHSTNPNSLRGPVSAKAQLLDSANTPLSAEVTVNHYGDFLLTRTALAAPTAAKVRIRCEQLPDEIIPVNLPVNGLTKLENIATNAKPTPASTVKLQNHRPTDVTVSVTLNGADISRPDLPQPTTLLGEMENAPGDDTFLTYKGLDTRKGACQYYKAIGAVKGCDADGFPTDQPEQQLTLSQWRKKFNLSAGDPGEITAKFINSMDLNFGRDYQGIKLPNGDFAINVCNYPGPQDVHSSVGAPTKIGIATEDDINLAIDNMKRGIGRVACVAMDYSAVSPDVNGGKPFVKFYAFGPSEKLLLSLSLDGRREKFLPGSCTACHGGDNYGGKFPEDGSGKANIGSYFLPFDVANFDFSTSDPALTRNQLLHSIRQLNELLVSIPTNAPTQPVTPDARALIATRWHTSLNSDEQQFTFPPAYLDQQILGTGTSSCTDCHGPNGSEGPYDARSIHQTVIARSCQICHASNGLVPDPQAGNVVSSGLPPRSTFFERPPAHYMSGTNAHTVCGGSRDLKMNYTMPNALVTFERFWLKQGTDQPTVLFSLPPPKTGQQSGTCSTLSSHPGL